MSIFKRKARVIQTLDDDLADVDEQKKDEPSQTSAPSRFSRKPTKSSSLRKSINFTDDHGDIGAPVEDEDEGASVVIRPSISRVRSTKLKKKAASSRLSFGPGATDEEGAATTTASTPRKSLSQKAAENSALKMKLPSRVLGGEEDRPRYSKDYLAELQSSTPHTPQDMSTLSIEDEDVQMAMDIDPSELAGATIVSEPGQGTRTTALMSRTPAATILTAAQIQEKKERRARLAFQGDAADYIGLSGSEEDSDADDRLASRKAQQKESRLVAEDEDLGEGYDDYVEDGGLSLGKTAEKKARMQRKKEMAELIASAEAPSDDDDSDDSLDRKAEYEAAQRRKGMGVFRSGAGGEDELGPDFIPKMKPLPDLNESIQRMRGLVQALDDDVARRRARIAQLKKEREEIAKREGEVQGILDEAGAKYQAVLGSSADAAKAAAQSPLRVPLPPGLVPHVPVERGLESFGTTPIGRDGIKDGEMEYDP